MKKPCEQFGEKRAQEIDALVQAATGKVCPGRMGQGCPLASTPDEVGDPVLRVVS